MSFKRMGRLRPWRSDVGGRGLYMSEGKIMQELIPMGTITEEQYKDLIYRVLNSR